MNFTTRGNSVAAPESFKTYSDVKKKKSMKEVKEDPKLDYFT